MSSSIRLVSPRLALAAAAIAALPLAASAQLAPSVSEGAGPVAVPTTARVIRAFPRTEHWFRIVHGQQLDVRPDGSLVPRHQTLTHPRVRWRDGAGHSISPRFPARYTGALRITSSHGAQTWVEVAPIDGDPARPTEARARVEDGLVVYAGAYRDTDIVLKSTPTHLDEYLVLWSADAPTRWRYRLSHGPGIRRFRQAGRSVEAVDDADAPWMRTAHPIAYDATGRMVEGEIRLEGDVLEVSLDTRGMVFPVLVDPDWRSTGDMAHGRFYHRANVLPDGRVLVTGGCSASICSGDLTLPDCRYLVGAVEALDLDTRTFSRLFDDVAARIFQVAEPLGDGRVLVTGGCAQTDCRAAAASAVVIDPATSSLREVATPTDVGGGMVSAPLPNGQILVAGGCVADDCSTRAEAFDPDTETFVPLAPMHLARARSEIALLSDGRVVVTGGCSSMGCAEVLSAAEIYDPAADTWTDVGSMAVARAGHFVVALADDRVMVGGGCSDQVCTTFLSDTEILDPATGTWSAGPSLTQPRLGAVAARLPDGTVMVSQGCSARGACDVSNELYDPEANDFGAIENAVTTRAFHQLLVHPARGVVIANGGCQPTTCSWWNETYDISGIRPLPDAGPPPRPDAGSDGGTRRDGGRGGADARVEPSADAGGSPAGTNGYQAPGCVCGIAGARSASPRAALVGLAGLVGLAVLLGVRRRRRARDVR